MSTRTDPFEAWLFERARTGNEFSMQAIFEAGMHAADPQRCGTCVNRQMHGRVPWCARWLGRPDDDCFCSDWSPRDAPTE